MTILAQDVGAEFLKYFTQAGGGTILAVFTYLWLTGKLVRKGELDRVIAERDRLEQLLWRALNLSETAADGTRRATDLATKAVITKEENGRRSP